MHKLLLALPVGGRQILEVFFLIAPVHERRPTHPLMIRAEAVVESRVALREATTAVDACCCRSAVTIRVQLRLVCIIHLDFK